ncbi:hypothetical protein M2428_001001 [Arthrobacter sp. ES3-54]|nr:hypothetical protein [Arthrobacter sp. ES3-54]
MDHASGAIPHGFIGNSLSSFSTKSPPKSTGQRSSASGEFWSNPGFAGLVRKTPSRLPTSSVVQNDSRCGPSAASTSKSTVKPGSSPIVWLTPKPVSRWSGRSPPIRMLIPADPSAPFSAGKPVPPCTIQRTPLSKTALCPSQTGTSRLEPGTSINTAVGVSGQRSTEHVVMLAILPKRRTIWVRIPSVSPAIPQSPRTVVAAFHTWVCVDHASDATGRGLAFLWRAYSNTCSKVVVWDRSRRAGCRRSMRVVRAL